MITKKEILEAHQLRLPDMYKPKYVKYLSSHEKDSASILSRVSRQLEKNHIEHVLDLDWPFHLVTNVGKKVSIFCGGFARLIEVHPLTLKGGPDKRYEERGFLTPQGAVNYILRRFQ